MCFGMIESLLRHTEKRYDIVKGMAFNGESRQSGFEATAEYPRLNEQQRQEHV